MINLEKLGLSTGEMLQRSQLATIVGSGSASLDNAGSCEIRCNESWQRSMTVNDCTLSTRRFYCPDEENVTCNCGESEDPELL
ncbi:hypothetical protein [Belliella pelovolcani]|uniref:Uncharacterized protein n=1 Tax=Belliella pelovolcani TaxID=529505 RepID=A0A1N7M5Q7_9BACT|nr:hypothetical protein [Belliella pelovolcani]SIS81339.1 hypothetical protein SAMN05421761_105114 [Belliella pelovolcani]